MPRKLKDIIFDYQYFNVISERDFLSEYQYAEIIINFGVIIKPENITDKYLEFISCLLNRHAIDVTSDEVCVLNISI